MLTFAPNMRIYLHARPTDMRKSFDGLCALVRNVFQADPLDGSLFLFVNRRGDRLKMLWWDRDGLALFYKRLEAGTFEVLRRDRRDRAGDALERHLAGFGETSQAVFSRGLNPRRLALQSKQGSSSEHLGGRPLLFFGESEGEHLRDLHPCVSLWA
jgi:hypothetical protein